MIKDEAQIKAAQLLNDIADMEWHDAVNLLAAAIRNAQDLGYSEGWSKGFDEGER